MQYFVVFLLILGGFHCKENKKPNIYYQTMINKRISDFKENPDINPYLKRTCFERLDSFIKYTSDYEWKKTLNPHFDFNWFETLEDSEIGIYCSNEIYTILYEYIKNNSS